MSDRELLELAAKAAGLEVVTPTMLNHGQWNPLEDDGDALRLAVKLRIFLCHGDLFNWFYGEIIVAGMDESLATRIAIVRAAAEIGRAMP